MSPAPAAPSKPSTTADFVPAGSGIIDGYSEASTHLLLPALKPKPRQHTFIFIAFAGLACSRNYVHSLQSGHTIRDFINLEFVGTPLTKAWARGSAPDLFGRLPRLAAPFK